ncbi:MAG: enolase C-terminal domain-like protein [Candidatus Daviesbacteria bacterium]|nr:enolase C-terminal domain-like protein [Candidatus Daviesbacteria bacterium]
MKVQQISVKIINDSRGEKTLEADLTLDGQEVTTSVPSGKSKGSNEAFVLEPELAIRKLDEIEPKLLQDFESLEQFDQFLIQLDGTSNKQNLGGNLILGLSTAFTKAWAKLQNLELFQLIAQISKQEIKLPLCFFNLINGGLHVDSILSEAEGPKPHLPFQEYLFIPQTVSPKQNLDLALAAINILKEKIQNEYSQVNYGDEGGFTVPSDDPLKGLQLLQNFEGKLGLDVAASAMSQKPSIEQIQKIAEDFNILSIEDPFDEEDWESFAKLTTKIGSRIWIVGDDLLTTNVLRIKTAHDLGAVNAVLIKPNQIGTITETIQAALLAKSYGWKIIVSHRSGETMDSFIADLAVGLGADGLKSGCPLQKERLVKYERLVEIERTW